MVATLLIRRAVSLSAKELSAAVCGLDDMHSPHALPASPAPRIHEQPLSSWSTRNSRPQPYFAFRMAPARCSTSRRLGRHAVAASRPLLWRHRLHPRERFRRLALFVLLAHVLQPEQHVLDEAAVAHGQVGQ